MHLAKNNVTDSSRERDERAVHDEQSTQPPIHFSATPEHVLVTGATGFIGQSLVQALIQDGHSVTVLSRDRERAARIFRGKAACIGGMDELPLSARVDVIVNLAGARILGHRWSVRRKQELRRSRIALTERMVTWIAAAEHKPRLLLSASAIGYYGVQARGDDRALTEDSPPQPVFMSQLCQEWEAAAQKATTHGVRVACMRFGVVFGRQGALPMMLLPIRLGLGGRLGSGRQWQSWIHLLDALRGMAHVWRVPTQAGSFEAYNFTAPESVTQEAFSKTAARILRRPCILAAPAWPMRLMLGEQADLLLEGQRVVPARLRASGFAFTYPDLQGALRSLC